MKLRLFCPVFALALSMAFGSGCGSPCKDLADKICDCMPTRLSQERCHTNVNAADSNTSISEEEEDRCQAILDSGRCTCEAIQAGDVSACGLANDAAALLGE
jgi:hypothetical protein